ncbi:probable aspartyl aminopeptidase [Tanacetum coccineum]
MKGDEMGRAELNKVVADNGPDGGKPNESPNDVSNQKHHSLLLQMLATQAGCKSDDICDFELQACDTQPSIIAGAMKEFIFSGRLDNLCMSFCSLKMLTVSDKKFEDECVVEWWALFDHEGSWIKFRRKELDLRHESKDKHEENHQPKLLWASD